MKVKAFFRGSRAVLEFLGPSGMPVKRELAEKRARICQSCPLNDKSWSLLKAIGSAAFRAAKSYLLVKQRLRLKVRDETSLGRCAACDCPLALKVHMPLDHILRFTEEETLAKFDPRCWILDEMEP